jgi:hypothetical protein
LEKGNTDPFSGLSVRRVQNMGRESFHSADLNRLPAEIRRRIRAETKRSAPGFSSRRKRAGHGAEFASGPQVREENGGIPVSGAVPGAKKADIVIIENGKGMQAVQNVVTTLRANRHTGYVKAASSTRKSWPDAPRTGL